MMGDVAVHVGPRNGRAERLVIFKHNGRELRDEFNTDRAYLREQAVKRVADRFAVNSADLGHLDSELVAKADAEDAKSEGGGDTIQFTTVSCAELATQDYQINYLVRDVLAEGVPCLVGGQLKTLKSILSINLAVSLATGNDFLGHFPVLQSARVVYFLGEGGLTVAQDYARRVAASYGLELADVQGLSFVDTVPQLASLPEIDAMIQAMRDTESTVAILDPLYLAMDGRDSGNIMAQGPIFRNFARACAAVNATPVIVHHLKKSRPNANPNDPPELAELSWSGPAEFAGQWVLLGRQEPYNGDEPGLHSLWLSCGGRAGHSSLHVLRIDEGRHTDVGGRYWSVDVQSPREAREGVHERAESEREAKREKRLERDKKRVIDALARFENGETKSAIRTHAGLSGERFNLALAGLLADGTVDQLELRKGNNRPYEAYKLSDSALEL